MVTPNIIIEPTDSAIKIVVGYVLNNKPIILYTATFPMETMIYNGNIIDIKGLSNKLKVISHIEDKSQRVRFDIKNAILVLPPVGLEIYEDKKSTSIISNLGKIDLIDVSNIIMMMKKGKIKDGYAFLDIIPTMYYLANGKTENFPIGLNSNYLGMKAIIYTLPVKQINGYCACLESSGIHVNKCFVANDAIAHLLNNKKDIPSAYIYVDVGYNYTSLSLISKTHVYNTSYFSFGGQQLTKRISDAFSIDLTEAEKLKRRYGYDPRLFSFNPIISGNEESKEDDKYFHIIDLNKVMKEYLEDFAYSFDTCLKELLSDYPEEKRNFPIIIGGAGSRLYGFLDHLISKYPDKNIKKVPLDVIGARNESYLNCVGALLAANTNNLSLVNFDKKIMVNNKNSISNIARKGKM